MAAALDSVVPTTGTATPVRPIEPRPTRNCFRLRALSSGSCGPVPQPGQLPHWLLNSPECNLPPRELGHGLLGVVFKTLAIAKVMAKASAGCPWLRGARQPT